MARQGLKTFQRLAGAAATGLCLSLWAASALAAEGVFLKAFYPLDEPRFHCVDIPGHKARVNTARPLSVHTCKEGIWHDDELFDPAALAAGHLRMPAYDMCVAAVAAQPGAQLKLAACDTDGLAVWRYGNYRLSLKSHPDLCLTIGPEASRLTPGGKRLASRHMARSLMLSLCDDGIFARQLWRFEAPQVRDGSVMPGIVAPKN